MRFCLFLPLKAFIYFQILSSNLFSVEGKTIEKYMTSELDKGAHLKLKIST